jgi:hypothetical protein
MVYTLSGSPFQQNLKITSSDLTRTALRTFSFNICRNVGNLYLTSQLTFVFRVLLSVSLSHITNITEKKRDTWQKMPLCLPFFIPLLDVTSFFMQAQTSVGNTSSNSDPAVSNTSFCTFLMSLCALLVKSINDNIFYILH